MATTLAAEASSVDPEATWQRYCGFLDLTVDEFMRVQERLLMEQIEMMYRSVLGRKIIGNTMPKNIDEFRKIVPFTTYDDYALFLNEKREDVLPEKPVCWAYTSGRSGTSKFVPYTQRGFDHITDGGITTLILACARRRGDNQLRPGLKVVYNLPPRPFYAGYVAIALTEKIGLRFLPPAEEAEKMQFDERIASSFKLALKHGVDIVASQTGVLLRIAESFATQSNKTSASKLVSQPAVLTRVIKGKILSGIANRAMLPRDLWSVKAIVCYGMDTAAYKSKLAYYWGREPYEVYGSTETGATAFQTWHRKGLTFSPFPCFLEFVPEAEAIKLTESRNYQPKSFTISEVEPGRRYELFITSFYGMPFMRYRTEDIFEVISLGEKESGVSLPQFTFIGRSRDIIDIIGFVQLAEKDFWAALTASNLQLEDWTVRKETTKGEVVLHFYVEAKDSVPQEEVEHRLHEALIRTNPNYRDLDQMLRLNPVKVTILPRGTFRQYYEAKRAEGAAPAQLKPPRTNASDAVITTIINLASRIGNP